MTPKPAVAPAGVAYVLPGLERGGAEKNVLDLVARIDRRKFSPCVVCTSEGGPLEDDLRKLGVPLHFLGYRGFSRNPRTAIPLLRSALAAFGRFRKILEKENVRIVHGYLPEGNVVGILSASACRVPVSIASKRALCLYKKGHPVYSFFEDACNLLADAVTANSAAVAEDVRKRERFLGGKIRVIRNGIDPDVPPPVPVGQVCPELEGGEGDPLVTYVANFHPYKGHRDLIVAARTVIDAFPAARFLLVGRDAGEMTTIRGMVASRGLARHVLFLGPRSDAMRVTALSTLVAHPSHQEGFPNTILEAMAAGKPVVATRTGGIPEAVIDGETGLLVPPGDPSALAAALLSLLRDPDRAIAMGIAGRRRVLERFPIGKMVGEVEQLYEELLAGKS